MPQNKPNKTLHYGTFHVARLDYKLDPKKEQHKYDWLRKYDLTPEQIIEMLKTTKVPLEMGLTELHLTPIEYFFRKPGQEYITNHMEETSTLVLFSTEPITFKTLKDYIKSNPEFEDYKILNQRTEDYKRNAPWHIHRIDTQDKKIILDQYPKAVVINPTTFEQVQPALPDNQGNISPVFEQFCQPIQLEAISPAEMVAYFERCKNK